MAVPARLADDGSLADLCEGCGTRDDGTNFAHEGLCKRCMASVMGASDEELPSHQGGTSPLTQRLTANAEVKAGRFTSWSDDGGEVEIRLKAPPAARAKELSVVVASRPRPTLRVVRRTAAGAEPLLFVDPLAGDVVGGDDDVVWYLDGGVIHIELKKLHAGMWGHSLCKLGGTLEAWPGAQ